MNDGSKNIVPYTKVVLPENTLHGNSTLSFTDQPAKILNRDIFTEFVRTAMFSEEFMLSVAGPTHAHVGKLKANINLEKNIKLKGQYSPFLTMEGIPYNRYLLKHIARPQQRGRVFYP
jgi:hypothetical protein